MARSENKTLTTIPDYHPKFVVPTNELARWLWGHMQIDQHQANLDYLLNIGEHMNIGAIWMYTDMQIAFELVEKDEDEDGLLWWSVQRKSKCQDYAATYDGKHFFVVLANQLKGVTETQEMPKFSMTIPIDSPVLGETSIVCSRELLLAGYNPAFCAHEYCLANNLYNPPKEKRCLTTTQSAAKTTKNSPKLH